MVGGVAVFDFDNDGLLDLYFVNGAALEDPMPAAAKPLKTEARYWNRLYRNRGDRTFEDVTEAAGVAGRHYDQGVATGDYDNDGFVDLYVTGLGGNILYRNTGDGTFKDMTRAAGVEGGGWSAGAGFLDYDADGDLDLVVTRYLTWGFDDNPWCGEKKAGYRSYCHPRHFEPIGLLLYRNDGGGSFTDVSVAAGLTGSPGKGLGLAINDFDRDGRADILVANDSVPQQLFRNTGEGAFEEVALPAGLAYDEDGNTFAGMGVDFQDYDNDGWPDVFINALAHEGYAIYHNLEGVFEYVSNESGVGAITQRHSGWGTKFIDYDNDGWKDIFVAQSHVMDNIELTQPELAYKEPFLIMRNTGRGFIDVTSRSGLALQTPVAARGAAFGDLDNDGFVDVVVSCSDEPAIVLMNQGNENHWLLVDLKGSVSNRHGIGAQVRVVADDGREQFGMASTAEAMCRPMTNACISAWEGPRRRASSK